MSDRVLKQQRIGSGKRRPTISPLVFFTPGALLLAFLAFVVLFF